MMDRGGSEIQNPKTEPGMGKLEEPIDQLRIG